MSKKFITTWFHCEADNETIKKKTGFLKKKEVEEKVYYNNSPNYDHYAEMLAKTYNHMDEHGYDVVNVVPINTGASEPYSGVLKNGKKHYMGEKCYSVTRGAVVVGKLKEVARQLSSLPPVIHENNTLRSPPQKVLTVELVPKTCWFSNVRSNVTQSQWNKLKRLTASKAGNKCEICGGVGPKWPVECHEIWSYDDTNKIQKLNGLISLCPSCHQVKHMGFANVKGNGDIATQHLAETNQWTLEKSKAYVRDQFLLWEQRSRHDWALDISWLEQHGIKPENHERLSD